VRASGLLLWLVCVAACAGLREELIDLPVTASSIYGRSYSGTIKVVVWRDDARERSPFMLLNHGRPSSPADMAKMGTVKYSDNSRYFVGLGFAVFVPTRMGYGVSGGEDLEYSGGCSDKRYVPAYEAAAQQSLQLIEYARSRPYVDAARGLVVGQSYGGMTSAALAAKNPAGVVAAVNFAGGGGGDPKGRPGNPCRADLLEALYAQYGTTARIPTLWLYSENDRYWGKDRPRTWFAAFTAKGAPAEFVQLPALPPELGDDGHATFTRHPSAWRPPFEAFLRQQGFLTKSN